MNKKKFNIETSKGTISSESLKIIEQQDVSEEIEYVNILTPMPYSSAEIYIGEDTYTFTFEKNDISARIVHIPDENDTSLEMEVANSKFEKRIIKGIRKDK